jgi:hypothetical protein
MMVNEEYFPPGDGAARGVVHWYGRLFIILMQVAKNKLVP